MQILVRWALNAVALYLTILLARYFHLPIGVDPGAKGAIAMVTAVVVLAIFNTVIRPVIALLTLPLSCVTFGLFAFVLNALMFWLASLFVPGFYVKSFMAALFGSITMGIISGALSFLVISDSEKERRR